MTQKTINDETKLCLCLYCGSKALLKCGPDKGKTKLGKVQEYRKCLECGEKQCILL